MLKFKGSSISAVGSVFIVLGSVGTAQAIVTFGSDPLDYQLDPGEFSGVASLNFLDTDARQCTSSLLPGGLHLLSAAHCFTDKSGVFEASRFVNNLKATFNLASGPASVLVSDFYIFRDWTGDLKVGDDVAVLKLAELAPAGAEQYDIYRGKDEVGQIFTKVGYGSFGIGDTGEDPNSPKVFPALSGQNRFDAFGEAFDSVFKSVDSDFKGIVSESQLLFDFDNGFAANDAFGVHFGINDLGVPKEVNIAPGDSGGPAFIGNNLIAGISSYNTSDRILFPAGPLTDTDIDDLNSDGSLDPIDSSFGEFSGDTRVSTYASFIDRAIAGKARSAIPTTSVPEPSVIQGILASLGLGILLRRKTKHQSLS